MAGIFDTVNLILLSYKMEVIMTTNALVKKQILPGTFDAFFRPWSTWFDDLDLRPNWATANLPAANVTERKGEFRLSLAIPGLDKDDLKITVEGDILTVSAENEKEQEVNMQRFTRQEYNYSNFSRSFSLPAGINKAHIAANYENGILLLTLPKKEEVRHNEGPLLVPVN